MKLQLTHFYDPEPIKDVPIGNYKLSSEIIALEWIEWRKRQVRPERTIRTFLISDMTPDQYAKYKEEREATYFYESYRLRYKGFEKIGTEYRNEEISLYKVIDTWQIRRWDDEEDHCIYEGVLTTELFMLICKENGIKLTRVNA